MLSVWIRGTGLRAHVEPFEDRGNDDDGDDMYNDESCNVLSSLSREVHMSVCYIFSSLSLRVCLCVRLLRFILTFSKGVPVCQSVTIYPHSTS